MLTLIMKMNIATLLLLSYLFSIFAYSEDRKELWSKGKEALAVCEISIQNRCYVIIDKLYIDVTQAEHSNIGKLDVYKNKEYEKIISFPSKWVTVSSPVYIVQITTHAWLHGQRYTVSELVYIKNGVYFQR